MEGLGWEGGAEVADSPSLWSNIYQPYLNYCAEINNTMDPIQRLPHPHQPFPDKYSNLVANNDVPHTSIIAPTTTIWQQNNTVQPLGAADPVNGSSLQQQQHDSLDCLLSTTNSNTDTSLDDELGGAISSRPMILPEHPRSFWNFGGGNSTASTDKGKEKRVSKKRGRCDDGEGSFWVMPDPGPAKPKRARPGKNDYNLGAVTSSTISFQLNPVSPTSSIDQAEPDQEAIAQMKEMIYRAAAFRPVNLGPEVVEKPKRKNVRTSSDPQTVAARQRRERISDRIRVLQRIVPGGTKMDTASMLDEAANYLKFLQTQIKALETLGPKFLDSPLATNCNLATSSGNLSFSSIPFTHPLLGPMHGHIPLL